MTDEMTLLETGEIDLKIGEASYRLRPPKVGEYKRLKAIVLDANDAIKDLRGVTAGARMTPAELAKVDVKKIDEINDAAMVAFVNEAVSTLSGHDLPDADEWPVWLTMPDLQTAWIKHWMQVPLGRG